MSKKKEIKATPPAFKADPRFQKGIDSLLDLGGRLSSFDFSGDLAPLQDTIDQDPEITKLALQEAQGLLGPAFEDTINQIKQEAIASNQFESSTFSDALARESGRLNSQFQAITAGAALDDRTRALQNRLAITEIGGGLTSQGTSFAGSNQNQRNDFAQRAFEQQLSIDTFNRDNSGGLFGGITGGIGGALLGVALAPVTGGSSLLLGGLGGLAGATAGALGPSGTGGSLLSAGSTASAFSSAPRVSAGNTSDLFGGIGTNSGTNNKLLRQLELFEPGFRLN